MSPITLSGRDLHNLRRVSMARSYDLTKPTLSGILIEPRGEDDLVAAATDGFVLAFAPLHIEGHGLTEKILVPATMAAEIQRRKLTQTSLFVIGDGEFRFFHKAGGIGAVAKAPEPGWTYPNWTKVLPAPGDLRPAKLEEMVFGRDTWEKATNALNGGKVEYPIEVREGAMSAGENRPVFTALEGVVVATMPIRFSTMREAIDSTNIREGLKAALGGVAA